MSFVVSWKQEVGNREREGLEAFVSLHRERVFRLALSITGRRDLAEDVSQDVLIRAFRHYQKLANSEDPLPWLRLTTVRRSLTELKKCPAPLTLPEPIGTSDIAARLAVTQTLGRLEPQQRGLLALAIGEGWTYQEIADALEIPVGTVASRLSAAKAAFRTLWGEER